MKKTILVAVLGITVLSCKQEKTLDYKYAEQPQVITCESIDTKLFNEAYYAFENAILIHAKNTNRRPNFNITPEYALRSYIMKAKTNIKITDYVTKETLDIFKTLRNKDIWNGAQLKNNAAITECIGESISNPIIKKSFNTLRSVESLNPTLMASAIADNRAIRGQYNDKVLMAYVAFDMYYSKFYNTNFSNVEFLVEKEPIIAPASKPVRPEIGKKLNIDTHKSNRVKHGQNDGHNHN
jgi:hypothetical protein